MRNIIELFDGEWDRCGMDDESPRGIRQFARDFLLARSAEADRDARKAERDACARIVHSALSASRDTNEIMVLQRVWQAILGRN